MSPSTPRDPILTHFSKYISDQLGIQYSEDNDFQLQKRLDDIAGQMGFADRQTLYAHSLKGIAGSFRQLVLDIATNNETSFFRDPLMYKALAARVLPEFAGRDSIRVWSAACSSGQEALSISMTITDWASRAGTAVGYSITGTDVSERVLVKARTGTYTQIEVNRGLGHSELGRFFTAEGTNWRARDEIRHPISFSTLNLKETFDFANPFDLIFCRNVLIYQNVEGKIAILNQLVKALRPGGYLVLGFGESLLGLSAGFEASSQDGVVFYRRKS